MTAIPNILRIFSCILQCAPFKLTQSGVFMYSLTTDARVIPQFKLEGIIMTKIRIIMAALLFAFAAASFVSSSDVLAKDHSNRCPTDNPGC